MDDDDEFGELYTDVLHPVAGSSSRTPPSVSLVRGRSDPLPGTAEADSNGSGGDGFMFGASPSDPDSELRSNLDQALGQDAASAQDDGEEDWTLGRAAPAVDPPENWDGGDDHAALSEPAVVEAPHKLGEVEPRVLKNGEEEARFSEFQDGDGGIGGAEGFGDPEEDEYPFSGGGAGQNSGKLDQAPLIPGLSAGPVSSEPSLGMNNKEGKPSQSEDWDSDSEDDLQIVLNDSNHRPPGAERDTMVGVDDDDDDGEEDLVIVTDEDQHHHLPAMEDQNWTEEAMQSGDGERKDMVDAGKLTGSVGTTTGPRIGYNNHGFHAQHHSMYKEDILATLRDLDLDEYVRPGAAPLPGDPAGGAGVPGSARPALGSGPISGQGRNDWRPVGGRGNPNGPKSYHTSFGFPAWGSNPARGLGSGLDFTLPSHKTIFDVDIQSFEEKPWRHPGVDISDFFNFGLDEDQWKDYCKRLDQHRLESTMQSKIRVYESGRSEQDYDPDLPPELAAAAGHDISVDNGHRKADVGETNFTSQGRGSSVMRAPLPTGRAIQVEGGGYGERFPSIDTRPPRTRDSDAIIEIVLQDIFDDPKMNNCAPEQLKKDVKSDYGTTFHEMEKDDNNPILENNNHLPQGYSYRNKEVSRRSPLGKEKDESIPLHSQPTFQHNRRSRTGSPVSQDETLEMHPGGRLPRGPSSRRHSFREKSTDSILSQNARSSRLEDQQMQTQDSTEVIHSGRQSPAVDHGTARELNDEGRYSKLDHKLAVTSMEGDDMVSDFHLSSETRGDDSLVHPTNKQKLISQVEQTAGHDVAYEDELQTSNSDNSREKSGSIKDYPRKTGNGEVMHEKHLSKPGYLKRPQKEDEHGSRQNDENRQIDSLEKEKIQNVSQGREEMPDSCQNPLRGRSYERRRESESSTSSWQRKEDNVHGRQTKDEDVLNDELSRHKSRLRPIDRNQKDEDRSRKHVDTEWRGHNREEGLRQRKRDDISMAPRENRDDVIKRKRDEEYPRGKADKIDTLPGHRDREDSGRRKKEMDDVQKRRKLETRTRDKVEDHLSSKHRDDSWRNNREREDRQRIKPHEIAMSNRDREEARGSVRTGRVAEDKSTGGNGRNRDESKCINYDKDYQGKEKRRRNEFSRRQRAREDNASQNKGRGDASANEKHSNADERISRHEKFNTHGDRHPTSDGQQKYRERQRENTNKTKDVSYQQNNHGVGKRKRDERQQNNKIIKDSNKQESNNISSTNLSKKSRHQTQEAQGYQHNTSRKQGEDDPGSDDNGSSKRGRSKLERWTSQKDRDYDVINNTQTLSASTKEKKDEGETVDVAQTDDLVTIEVNNIAGEFDAKGADGGQIVDKVDDQDRHLDTVAKLKKRSERFKLPMPRDKEIASNKKLENEVQLSNIEIVPDSEIKLERPARKRRWTGS